MVLDSERVSDTCGCGWLFLQILTPPPPIYQPIHSDLHTLTILYLPPLLVTVPTFSPSPIPSAMPSALPSPSPTQGAGETADAVILCDFYNTVPAGVTTGGGKLTNWCGAKSAGVNYYVNGPCSTGTSAWLGVTCSTANRVTTFNLNIAGNLGGGSLPTSVGGLDVLTFLGLNGNSLSGTIPSELGLLTGMTRINLNYNNLVGTIPSELGGLTGLIYLGVGANTLSGTIPSELGLLTNLNELCLSTNNLVSPVPTSLCLPIKTAPIYIYSNTGLTCYPSCLTNPPYARLNKDTTLTTVCDTGK